MAKIPTFAAWFLAMAVFFSGATADAKAPDSLKEGQSHEPIVMKGYDGKELTINDKEPYSPRQTCGACHDYDKITNGYHFQQGRTDGSGKIIVSDNFNPKKPWHKSPGMFGKW